MSAERRISNALTTAFLIIAALVVVIGGSAIYSLTGTNTTECTFSKQNNKGHLIGECSR